MSTPRQIGPYPVLAELGEGGMARVHRVRDPRSGKELALKVLKPDLAQRESILHRFVREARILMELDHPGVVKVLDVGPPEPPVWFAMELVVGTGLDRLLEEEKPLPDEQSLAMAQQVLAALEHAHARGVVHRDLKPENVLLDGDGRARLTDFGIAKLLEGTQLTATGAQLGTPQYMAPEQVRGRRSMGAGVDVYAAGVLLYEMLTGKPPFRGEDPVAIGYAHNFEPPPPLKRRGRPVPDELQELVLKALEKKPQARFRSVRSMRRQLEKVARKLEMPLPRLPAEARRPPRPRQATPSRPDDAPAAAPRSRHRAASEALNRVLVRLLVVMVAGSILLNLIPGMAPGQGARDPVQVRQARRRFLDGLGRAAGGDWRSAEEAWRSAARLDPGNLLLVRDHAAQAFEDALARGQAEPARSYLELLRWADPGWEPGLEAWRRYQQAFPDAAPPAGSP